MRHRAVAVVVVSVLALAMTGSAQASPEPIVIGFEKDCPELTCEETSGSPVDVSTSITPVAFGGGVLHYTASETITSTAGSVQLSLTGMLNLNTDPDLTVVHGTVVSGSWNGVAVGGARIHVAAVRVGSSTVFRGTITILPGSAG